MAYLIAILGSGKGSWGQLSGLMRAGGFERIILITNAFGKEHYTPDAKTALVVTDFNLPLPQLRDDIKAKLAPLFSQLLDTDVAVNLVSGLGHEHMAMLAAILQLGLGIRLVSTATGSEGMIEL